MINFTRSFDLAWERMVVILFRPFNLGKWFVIGLSAFLAGFLAGGNGVNGSFNTRSFDPKNWSASYHVNVTDFNNHFSSALSALTSGVMVFAVILVFAMVLLFLLLFYWLGSRGQFLFLDNIVRNRGAIAWPWQVYARQANSLFGFLLIYFVLILVVLMIFAVPGFFAVLPLLRDHRWPEGIEIPAFILGGLIYFVISTALSVALFLFRELGVPLMFRNGLLARAAFGETWNLVKRYPGPIVLFLLLRIALFIALAVLCIVACCCFCLGAIPYIGTVMLLPALIYIKCFTLDFLAQFGPEYDVWTVDVAPASLPSANPPPPLG